MHNLIRKYYDEASQSFRRPQSEEAEEALVVGDSSNKDFNDHNRVSKNGLSSE